MTSIMKEKNFVGTLLKPLLKRAILSRLKIFMIATSSKLLFFVIVNMVKPIILKIHCEFGRLDPSKKFNFQNK